MQRGLAEDNKEVRESGWVGNRRERERKRCICLSDVSGHESQSGRGVCADYSSQGTYVHTYMGIHLAGMHVHMHRCRCALVCITYVHTHVCAYAVVEGFDGYIPEYECTCVSGVVCVCVHIHVYVCVCLCVPSTWPCCVVRRTERAHSCCRDVLHWTGAACVRFCWLQLTARRSSTCRPRHLVSCRLKCSLCKTTVY